VTPLSRVITSFHPIERHGGTGARRGGGGGDEGGGMDGVATRRRGEKKGRWWAFGGRRLRCTSLLSLCPDSCEVFWKKKRVALQRPSPPASHLPPTSIPLFRGHLWAGGVGSGGIERACTLTYCHIFNCKSKLCAMAMKEIFLPSSFYFFNLESKRWAL